MKEKGFTLIELLAVIVILAIISLIAVPIVLNIISSSKKDSYIRSAEIYVDNLQNLIMTKNVHDTFDPWICEYNKETKKTICEYYDEEGNTKYEKFDVLTAKTMPENITIYLGNGRIETGSKMTFADGTIITYIDEKWKTMNSKPRPKPIKAKTVYYDVKKGNLCSEDEYNKSYSKEYGYYLNSAANYNGINPSDIAITKELVNGTGTSVVPVFKNDDASPWISFNGGYKSNINITEEEQDEEEAKETSIEYTFTLAKSGALTFDWSVSSEELIDYLSYQIKLLNDSTGEKELIYEDYISGIKFEDEESITYENVSKILEPGKYSVTFNYSNDGTIFSGYNSGYIKNFKVLEGCEIKTTINQNSCLKFYEISSTDTVQDLILDHNTSTSPWISKEDYKSSDGANDDCKDSDIACNDIGPITALKNLKRDTNDWITIENPISITINQSYTSFRRVSTIYDTGMTIKYDEENAGSHKVLYSINYTGFKARLITADEVAKITGNNTWFKSQETSIKDWFYFDSEYEDTYENKEYQIQKSDNINYGWLFENLRLCTWYGCLNEDDYSTDEYWTSTSASGYYQSAWTVSRDGKLKGSYSLTEYEDYNMKPRGIRPVITISKNK